jgi:uncharacterized membrane protein YeaQ/YmgE (transglycosylase-associated protein family)
MEAVILLATNLISGVVGGNIAGLVFRKISLGVMGNTLAGIVGGSLGAQLLSAAPLEGLSGIWGQLLSGGIGGGAIMIIIGLIRKSVNR